MPLFEYFNRKMKSVPHESITHSAVFELKKSQMGLPKFEVSAGVKLAPQFETKFHDWLKQAEASKELKQNLKADNTHKLAIGLLGLIEGLTV